MKKAEKKVLGLSKVGLLGTFRKGQAAEAKQKNKTLKKQEDQNRNAMASLIDNTSRIT